MFRLKCREGSKEKVRVQADLTSAERIGKAIEEVLNSYVSDESSHTAEISFLRCEESTSLLKSTYYFETQTVRSVEELRILEDTVNIMQQYEEDPIFVNIRNQGGLIAVTIHRREIAPSIKEQLEFAMTRISEWKRKAATVGFNEKDMEEKDRLIDNIGEYKGILEWFELEYKKSATRGGEIDEYGRTVYYMQIVNNSPFDFSKFSVEASLIPKEGREEPVLLFAKDWSRGEEGDLFFRSKYTPNELSNLNIDAQSIRYVKA